MREMEGWLYVIRSNRLGLHHSSKRYFVLDAHNSLNCYRSIPTPSSTTQDLIRSAFIDSCIRVSDNGRESIHGNVFYIFTLYNTANHNDRLKLGARSSEEAARWIRYLMEAALKECPTKGQSVVACSKRRSLILRLSRNTGRSCLHSTDWTALSFKITDPMSPDVIAPSSWTIFGCKNGLRLFKEANNGDFRRKWDDHPAVMAVGVVDATPESIFHIVMSLGPSRSGWDFCFAKGRVGMKRRDLLLRRYWRREDDGTYIILCHSVFHQSCPPERGCIRACLKSGGYVISPINQGKQSVVKHMLAIDWKFWRSYIFTSSAKYITIRMLGRVAALRELCHLNLGSFVCLDFPSGEVSREIRLSQREEEVQLGGESSRSDDSTEGSRTSPTDSANTDGSLFQLSDAADEFFDFPDESEFDQPDVLRTSEAGMQSEDQQQSRLSTAAALVRRLHDLAVHKEALWKIHETYLQDRHKIKAGGTLMQMVAADWLKSNKREDDLGGRPGSIVQKYGAQGGTQFFFIVHIQVPGSTTYSLALYYMMDIPLKDVPLLDSFVRGDDAFRNSRFKLIPYISKGSWLVKQSVGRKACLVGQALEIHYFQGRNYLELGIDIGSSTVARGVVGLVLGYLNNLVIEMAFLIQGNTEAELPEFLLGTCRLNHLDASKAVAVKSL
uniref:Protein ENHANCED DISEASE RESISTANCE 2-like n=1 Tax=Ananas comosus var. bracteatus TaxID=296719 RepID=A0A6V7NQM6_ANACO|nr:unnamed protein product [Ananas comosus var. bracteatus]